MRPPLHEFAAAARLYEALAEGRPIAAEGEAARLLAGLGYVAGAAMALTPGVGANRLALLRLAARFERVFRLPLPHAPGAHFLGAQVAVAPFGLEGFDFARVSAGGRGRHLVEAFESCVGEAAERLCALQLPNDPRIAVIDDDRSTPDTVRAWVNAGLGVEAGATWRGEPGVCMTDLIGGDRVKLPAELVLRPPSGRRRAPRLAETTGLAAGRTAEDALVAGLLEAIERDAVALWWYGGSAGGRLDAPPDGWPRLARLVKECGRDKVRPHWFLDISSGIAVPVIACVSAGRDGEAAVAGFAAHPDPETAACRALLEMAQMELAQHLALLKREQAGEAALSPGDRAWIARHDGLSLERFPRLAGGSSRPPPQPADTGDGPRLRAHILAALAASGLRPLAADMTLAAIGIPVARIVVPGLQSVRPDWLSPRLETTARGGAVDLESRRRDLAPI